MIQFKRLTTSTNINNIQLEAGQPLVDLKNSYFYIGKGGTNKLKFYDSAKVDTIKSDLNSHIDAAKQSLNELKTSVDKKVDTIKIMSRNLSGGGTTSNSVKPTNGSITFTPGMNVQLEVKDNNVIEISSSDKNTEYSLATKDSNGLMSKYDFQKLDGIDAGANNYTLPSANADNLGGIKVKSVLKKEDINGDNHKYYGIDIDPDGKAVVDVPMYQLPTASTNEKGGVKVKSVLESSREVETVSENHKYYGIDIDKDGKAFVDVPWTDTVYTLPTASSSTLGGIKIPTDGGITYKNGVIYPYALCDKNTANHDELVFATSSSTYTSDTNYRGLLAKNELTMLGTPRYPWSKLYATNIYINGTSQWDSGISDANYTSLNEALSDINSRLDSLGFNGGQSVKVSGIGSSDFTLTIYKLGKVVWCNQSISLVQYVNNKRKSTTYLPSDLRPSSNAVGAILGYNVKSGPYTAGYSSQITIDTDGFITLEVNNDISVGGSTGYFMNYICFAYKLD